MLGSGIFSSDLQLLGQTREVGGCFLQEAVPAFLCSASHLQAWWVLHKYLFAD